jgi:hypothetical protein
MKTILKTILLLFVFFTIAYKCFAQDGNSPEALACNKEAEAAWRRSPEDIAWERTKNSITTDQHRYAILSKKKRIDITISMCKQYFTQLELNAFCKVSKDLEAEFYTMGGCDGLTEINCNSITSNFLDCSTLTDGGTIHGNQIGLNEPGKSDSQQSLNQNDNSISQSMDLALAKINNTAQQLNGSGNQQSLINQQNQINQMQRQLLSQQLNGLTSFLTNRYSNTGQKWDGDWNSLSLNEKLYGSARMSEYNKQGQEESAFKKIREQLYESIKHYSYWYLDSLIRMAAAPSAISWQTGDPDLLGYEQQNRRLPARRFIESNDGYNLAVSLNAQFKSPIDPNTGKGFYHKGEFDFLNGIALVKHEKIIASEIRRAEKGNFESILNVFYLYTNGSRLRTGNGTDFTKSDYYFQKFINHPEAKNGSVQNSKILTAWVMLYWCQVNINKPGTRTKEELNNYLSLTEKCDDLLKVELFQSGIANKFGERFKSYYQIEQFFDSYFYLKSSQMNLSTKLIPLSSDNEKESLNAKIISIYYDVAKSLRPIFENPILKRQYKIPPKEEQFKLGWEKGYN